MFGIDICEKAIANCKKEGINAVVGNAEEIKFPDNKFDWIVMSAMIEHVIDQKKALREAHRVLKDSGKLLLTTDNIWWQLVMRLKNVIFPWKPKYKRFRQPIDDEFTYRRLRKMLEECGFRVIQRERSGPFAIGEKYLRKFNWSICLHKRHWLICEKIR